MKLLAVEGMRLLGVNKTLHRSHINQTRVFRTVIQTAIVKHNLLEILGFYFFTQLAYWSRPKNTP